MNTGTETTTDFDLRNVASAYVSSCIPREYLYCNPRYELTPKEQEERNSEVVFELVNQLSKNTGSGEELASIVEYMTFGGPKELGTNAVMRAKIEAFIDLVNMGMTVPKRAISLLDPLIDADTNCGRYLEFIELLAAKGADVNAETEDGIPFLESVLQYERPHLGVVKCMLRLGASVNPTSLQIARDNKDDELVHLLEVHLEKKAITDLAIGLAATCMPTLQILEICSRAGYNRTGEAGATRRWKVAATVLKYNKNFD